MGNSGSNTGGKSKHSYDPAPGGGGAPGAERHASSNRTGREWDDFSWSALAVLYDPSERRIKINGVLFDLEFIRFLGNCETPSPTFRITRRGSDGAITLTRVE